jgi:prepilin-type N-terminal cleavage/methylation domain-containing protein
MESTIQTGTRPVTPTRKADAGFSLVELLIVVAVGATLLGTAIIMTRAGVTAFEANGALDSLRSQLHVAREQALSRQRVIRIAIGTNQLDLFEQQPNPANPEVRIGSVVLPGKMTFTRLPTGDLRPSDVWCQITGTTPILNVVTTLRINSEGSLTDDTGTLVSGCIYIGQTGVTETARAVSIFGSTGSLKAYKWNGTTWVR